MIGGLSGPDKSIVGEGDLPLAAALARDGIGLGLGGGDLKHYQHKSTSRKIMIARQPVEFQAE